MRLYLDSADVAAWEHFLPSGLFHGITTNPLLAERAGWLYCKAEFSHYLKIAERLGAQELHIQVFGEPSTFAAFAQRIFEEGRQAGIEAVVKIPMVVDAYPYISEIRKFGGKILMTACYESAQAIIAKRLKADYVAPYFGRMADLGADPLAEAACMQRYLEGTSCMLLAASIRSTKFLAELAAIGVAGATISTDLANQLLSNRHSLDAVLEFDAAAFGMHSRQ